MNISSSRKRELRLQIGWLPFRPSALAPPPSPAKEQTGLSRNIATGTVPRRRPGTPLKPGVRETAVCRFSSEGVAWLSSAWRKRCLVSCDTASPCWVRRETRAREHQVFGTFEKFFFKWICLTVGMVLSVPQYTPYSCDQNSWHISLIYEY